MKHETVTRRAEEYRLMLLVEHLQRQHRSEAEIIAAVREATSSDDTTVSES